MRRLDAPGDFVRLEIAKALERGVRVIPVLVSGAAMPRAGDLPEALRPLAVHQAIDVRDAHFHADANQLIDLLQGTVPGPGRADVAEEAAMADSSGECHAGRGRRDRRPQVSRVEIGSGRSRSRAGRRASVAGKWTGTVKYDWGDSYEETFDFDVAGGELSGTASFLQRPRGILDGKLEGNRVSFTTKSLTSTRRQDVRGHAPLQGHGRRRTSSSFTLSTDSGAESHVPVRFTVRR